MSHGYFPTPHAPSRRYYFSSSTHKNTVEAATLEEIIMNALDAGVLHLVNGFARRSMDFDNLVVLLVNNQFIKSAPLFAAYWFAWFRLDSATERRRTIVFATFAASLVTLVVGRSLALLLPLRLRPIDNPQFVAPYGMEGISLKSWSSFPSDHAMIYVALVAGVFALSRRLGWLALSYVVVIVLLPRIYLGLHYATDVFAGGILGAAIVYAALRDPIRRPVAGYGLRWSQLHPASFYAIAFVFAWQMAMLFDDVRHLADFSWHELHRLAALSH